MLRDWDKRFPGRIDNMFSAMAHVVPSHLMDRKLYPFQTIRSTGIVNPEGDKAFDEEDECAPADVVRLQLDR